MAKYLFVAAITVLALAAGMIQSYPASAAFHCMRIHAVMGGFNGNNNVQFVELRMNTGGQNFLAGHTLKFYNSANSLRATFIFPDTGGAFVPEVPNASTGDSILIATSEFNSLASGTGGVADSSKLADFVFSVSNTTGADALHPVQFTGGKVAFAEEATDCAANGPPVDSVAYGSFSGTVDHPPAATALPSPSDNRALRLNTNVNPNFPGAPPSPSNNSTEYGLFVISGTTGTATDPRTDLDTPRNNARTEGSLQADADGDGVADGSDQCPGTPASTAVDTNGCSQAQVDGDLDGKCDPLESSPSWCTGTDNCPTNANATQANLDGDGSADACDPDIDGDGSANGADPDDDNDGVNDADEGQCGDDQDNDSNAKANDGCPAVGAAESGSQCDNNTDNDADTFVNDGCPGATEANGCGGNSSSPSRKPERMDTVGDDDGDGATNEALPAGAAALDCDGDGWNGTEEMAIFAAGTTANNQDPCGNNGWPADLDPNNTLSIGDFNSFTFPLGSDDGHGTFAYFGHTVPDAGRTSEERWNLGGGAMIDIGDLNAISPAVSASTARPPMFGGAAAFAQTCPYPP